MAKPEIVVPAEVTKEEVRRAAVLGAHTYRGHTAAEWGEHAEGLRRLERDNGGEPDYSDAETAEMIAEALEELDGALES